MSAISPAFTEEGHLILYRTPPQPPPTTTAALSQPPLRLTQLTPVSACSSGHIVEEHYIPPPPIPPSTTTTTSILSLSQLTIVSATSPCHTEEGQPDTDRWDSTRNTHRDGTTSLPLWQCVVTGATHLDSHLLNLTRSRKMGFGLKLERGLGLLSFRRLSDCLCSLLLCL